MCFYQPRNQTDNSYYRERRDLISGRVSRVARLGKPAGFADQVNLVEYRPCQDDRVWSEQVGQTGSREGKVLLTYTFRRQRHSTIPEIYRDQITDPICFKLVTWECQLPHPRTPDVLVPDDHNRVILGAHHLTGPLIDVPWFRPKSSKFLSLLPLLNLWYYQKHFRAYDYAFIEAVKLFTLTKGGAIQESDRDYVWDVYFANALTNWDRPTSQIYSPQVVRARYEQQRLFYVGLKSLCYPCYRDLDEDWDDTASEDDSSDNKDGKSESDSGENSMTEARKN